MTPTVYIDKHVNQTVLTTSLFAAAGLPWEQTVSLQQNTRSKCSVDILLLYCLVLVGEILSQFRFVADVFNTFRKFRIGSNIDYIMESYYNKMA